MIKIFRFQGTKEIETQSYFEDLMDFWFSLENYRDTFDIDEVPSYYVEELIEEHIESLSLRDISVSDLISKLLLCYNEEEVWDLSQKYKLKGVFAIYDSNQDLQVLFEESTSSEFGLRNNFLIQAKAKLIRDFGKEYGVLVEILEIDKVYVVPKELIKKA